MKAASPNFPFLHSTPRRVTLNTLQASVEDGYRVSPRPLNLPPGFFPQIVHVRRWKYSVILFLNLVKI